MYSTERTLGGVVHKHLTLYIYGALFYNAGTALYMYLAYLPDMYSTVHASAVLYTVRNYMYRTGFVNDVL